MPDNGVTKMGYNSVDSAALKSFVARIERLEEDKAAIAADIKDLYIDAKAVGFDTKILRKLIALRRKDTKEREEEEALLEAYMQALGMLADTPLGQAAIHLAGLSA